MGLQNNLAGSEPEVGHGTGRSFDNGLGRWLARHRGQFQELASRSDGAATELNRTIAVLFALCRSPLAAMLLVADWRGKWRSALDWATYHRSEPLVVGFEVAIRE
jgi:hypothetical protein